MSKSNKNIVTELDNCTIIIADSVTNIENADERLEKQMKNSRELLIKIKDVLERLHECQNMQFEVTNAHASEKTQNNGDEILEERLKACQNAITSAEEDELYLRFEQLKERYKNSDLGMLLEEHKNVNPMQNEKIPKWKQTLLHMHKIFKKKRTQDVNVRNQKLELRDFNYYDQEVHAELKFALQSNGNDTSSIDSLNIHYPKNLALAQKFKEKEQNQHPKRRQQSQEEEQQQQQKEEQNFAYFIKCEKTNLDKIHNELRYLKNTDTENEKLQSNKKELKLKLLNYKKKRAPSANESAIINKNNSMNYYDNRLNHAYSDFEIEIIKKQKHREINNLKALKMTQEQLEEMEDMEQTAINAQLLPSLLRSFFAMQKKRSIILKTKHSKNKLVENKNVENSSVVPKNTKQLIACISEPTLKSSTLKTPTTDLSTSVYCNKYQNNDDDNEPVTIFEVTPPIKPLHSILRKRLFTCGNGNENAANFNTKRQIKHVHFSLPITENANNNCNSGSSSDIELQFTPTKLLVEKPKNYREAFEYLKSKEMQNEPDVFVETDNENGNYENENEIENDKEMEKEQEKEQEGEKDNKTIIDVVEKSIKQNLELINDVIEERTIKENVQNVDNSTKMKQRKTTRDKDSKVKKNATSMKKDKTVLETKGLQESIAPLKRMNNSQKNLLRADDATSTPKIQTTTTIKRFKRHENQIENGHKTVNVNTDIEDHLVNYGSKLSRYISEADLLSLRRKEKSNNNAKRV